MVWGQSKSDEDVSKTDKLKMFGKFIGASISSASSAAHDKMLLRKHEKLRVGEPVTGTYGTGRIRVDAITAADLRHSRKNPDPYCLVAVGRVGAPWAEKARSGAVAKTPVVLRQRHPRWLEPLALPLPAEGDDVELTVRVMDANVRGDACVGEARLPLKDATESSAVTVRLLGGGFASCSIRWSVLHLHGEAGEALLQPPSVEDFCADASAGPDTLSDFEGCTAPSEQPAPSAPEFCPPKRNSAPSEEGAAPSGQPEMSRRRAARGGVVLPSSRLGERLREDPFAAALAFWMAAVADASLVVESEVDAASGPSPRALRHVVAALAAPSSAGRTPAEEAGDRAGINELILQAPLAWALAGDAADLVVEAISGSADLLEPLARSRVAGVLLEQLKQQGEEEGRARKKEQLLHQLLKTSTGDSLMELKRLIDTAGTGQNLLSACEEISPELCTSLMDHFLVEGSKVLRKPVHVLSDIDMTVWVGTFGAGGPKFPQGPIPGALSLFKVLGGRITFLSARPPVWESRTRSALLDDIGIAEATILPGTLENVVRCLFQPTEARRGMGQQKEKAFNEFVDLYPEARFVFFGDSGEGDVDFALAFMQDAANAAAVSVSRVALIHDVVGPDGVEPKTSPEEREAHARKGVQFFDTYVGAALHLFRLGILDEWELRRAAQSCADELYERAPGEFKSLEVSKARQEELRRDLDAMAAILGGDARQDSGDAAAPVPFYVAPCAAREQQALETALGVGGPQARGEAAAGGAAAASSGEAAGRGAPARPMLRRDSGDSQASDLRWE